MAEKEMLREPKQFCLKKLVFKTKAVLSEDLDVNWEAWSIMKNNNTGEEG